VDTQKVEHDAPTRTIRKGLICFSLINIRRTLFHQRSDIYIEWIRLAEGLIKEGDYEAAAQHIRRVAHYFKLNNDMGKFREFMRKTGECYLSAAEKLWNSGQAQRAFLPYIKALDCYREIEDYASAERCSLAVRKCYAMTVKDGLKIFRGSSLDLKYFGDYFRAEEEIEKAIECYEVAARKAIEEGKLILAGGLYRDAGDCSSLLKDVERATANYAMAADNYFKSEKYFEAAWDYSISGFLLISLKRFDEASIMAEKAKKACSMGNIFILLNHLSKVCEQLSKRNYYAAEEE